MLEQIMMDGEPLQVGDRVYSILHGWGEVEIIETDNTFRVNFGNIKYWCDKSFVPCAFSKVRVIFWDEIKITPPPKLKKKKVWDWFVQWKFQGSTRIDKLCATTEGLVRETYTGAECIIQKIDGTEREVER